MNSKAKSSVSIVNVQWVSPGLVFHIIFHVYDALLNFKKEPKITKNMFLLWATSTPSISFIDVPDVVLYWPLLARPSVDVVMLESFAFASLQTCFEKQI